MRIIIVQAEIEEAIKAYVLNQITVREGQEITIDFRNTRGDDGATAEVNIATSAPGNGKSPEKPVQSVSSAPATKTQPKASTASPAPAVAATKPISSEPAPSAPAASSITANTEQGSTDEGTKEEGDEAAADAAAEETFVHPLNNQTKPYDEGREEAITAQEAEAAKVVPVQRPSFLNPAPAAAEPVPQSGKSLFANLTKPVNPKPPAEG